MKKVILTCFKMNIPAIQFYKKCGFKIDASSPTNYGNRDELYEIFSCDTPSSK